MLRSVVTYCLRSSLNLQDLVESAKVLFVELAEKEIQRVEQKINNSRITAMTGVHRKDVVRILKLGPGIPDSDTFITRVMGQWQSDPRFLTAAKKPRVLVYEGDHSEFHELCKAVSQDLKAGTIAFEMERIGAVERTRKGLKLTKGAFSVKENYGVAYRQLGLDLEDLLSAVDHNISESPKLPNLHARTEYDNVYVDALPKIRKWVLEEGSRFHRKLRDYVSKFDKDIHPGDKPGGGRIVIGSFSNFSDEPVDRS